jgi:hypothetical protein
LIQDRWEHGSDFPLSSDLGRATLPWSGRPHGLWGSGRQALRGLLEWGRDRHGWRRLLVPSYFCQHTLGSLTGSLPMEAYPCAPTQDGPTEVRTRGGDVVLAALVFGSPAMVVVEGSAVIVEDHSHGPGSAAASASQAHYAVASLRKALPLPDGGVLWTPRGLGLPDGPVATDAHRAAVLARLSAMLLKQHYLAGGDAPKEEWRAIFVESERHIGEGGPAAISDYARLRLGSLPIAHWAELRERNLAAFRGALGEPAGVELLDVPYAAIIVFADGEQREVVRRALQAERIYASVLWPLEEPAVAGIPDAHVSLSRRLLAIHADQRYGPDDMRRVAGAVRHAVGRA